MVDKKSRPVWPSQELLGVFPGLMSQGSSIYQASLPREVDLRARGEVWVWFLLRIFFVSPKGNQKMTPAIFWGTPVSSLYEAVRAPLPAERNPSFSGSASASPRATGWS